MQTASLKVFRYQQDIIPVLLFFTYFALDLLIFFTVANIWFVLLWMLLGILPKACICAWNHHHQHVPTFNLTFMNRLLELVYAFQTGIVTNGWLLHHVLGHHQHYLDQTKDESRWKDSSGQKMNTIKYSFATAITGYPRAYFVGRLFPKHQKPFLYMSGIVIALLICFCWYNWVNTLVLFILPMWISLYITAWHTYYHHAGLETDDEFEASYNITDRLYNVFTGNLGYYTAHHMKMGLHWSKLPSFHEQVRDRIPDHLYRLPPPPFRWLIKG
jgi:fatty acid desaturase